MAILWISNGKLLFKHYTRVKLITKITLIGQLELNFTKPSWGSEADRRMTRITQWLLFENRELRFFTRNTRTQFSVPCRQNTNLCQFWLSQSSSTEEGWTIAQREVLWARGLVGKRDLRAPVVQSNRTICVLTFLPWRPAPIFSIWCPSSSLYCGLLEPCCLGI